MLGTAKIFLISVYQVKAWELRSDKEGSTLSDGGGHSEGAGREEEESAF